MIILDCLKYFYFFYFAANNKVSKSELAPTVQHQELSMKTEALRKENEARQELFNALKKDHFRLKKNYKIIDLNYQSLQIKKTLRDSEIRDLKSENAILKKQLNGSKHESNNPSANKENKMFDDNDDDDDVEVIEYVRKNKTKADEENELSAKETQKEVQKRSTELSI